MLGGADEDGMDIEVHDVQHMAISMMTSLRCNVSGMVIRLYFALTVSPRAIVSIL